MSIPTKKKTIKPVSPLSEEEKSLSFVEKEFVVPVEQQSTSLENKKDLKALLRSKRISMRDARVGKTAISLQNISQKERKNLTKAYTQHGMNGAIKYFTDNLLPAE